jgi:quercetin dioxygenase-like cupin family protein
MEVKSIDAVPAQDGPEQYFSGRVQIRPLFSASEPARMSCGCVTFDPCARSAWHTHPLGQTLIVMSGRGFVQSWGGPVREIRAGDVIWTPPGEKHWHGAAPDSSMTHIAIQEALDGKNVDWMEKVSDEQYRR